MRHWPSLGALLRNGFDIILTDLDSTNGTRVNGTAIQIRRLRPGDQVSIGRTMLLFGTMEEIAARRAGSQLASHAATIKQQTTAP